MLLTAVSLRLPRLDDTSVDRASGTRARGVGHSPVDLAGEGVMDIMFERCAGIDVHKRTVVVCRLTRDVQGTRVAETQTFGTTTSELLRLSDWLTEGGCTPVGLESTGEFWKPVFNLLEGGREHSDVSAGEHKAVLPSHTDLVCRHLP